MRVAFLFLVTVLASGCSAAAKATATPRVTASAAGSTVSPTTPPPTPTSTPSPATTAAVRYVALGASDTVGVGATDPTSGSWPARVAALLPAGSAYVNLGVSGSIAIQAKDQQLPGAIAQKPTVISIWLAVNDMNATIQADSYQGAIGTIIDGLVTRTDAKIFVGNVPDVRSVPAYANADKNALLAQINAYNAAIAAVIAKYPGRAFAVDLFTGSAGLVSTMTVSGDGFHPSDDGYKLIAERFIAAMKANGVPLRAG